MTARITQLASPYLTSASRAEELCTAIFACWEIESVVLDFSDVRTISPSFVNTLLLNLLHRVTLDELKQRVEFANVASHVREAINNAIERHLSRGIELSAYLPA